MQKRTVHPFLPIFSADSRVLILGSFPSVRSRAEGFYYSHPRNRFWPLMSILFHRDAESVEDRTTLLLDNHIALWDAAASCLIEGSSDISMKDVIPCDIPGLLEKTSIERIFTNGKTAYSIYSRFSEPLTGIRAEALPSTSPANAAWSLERLVDVWGRALGEK